MSLFKGKNDTKSSAELIFERAKYKKHMNKNPDLAIKDFSLGEFNQYGRIDPSMNTVYNNGLSLKPLVGSSPGQTHLAIDFVSDAYKSIKNKIREAILKGAMSKKIPFISDLQPTKAYQNPVSLYESYMNRMMSNYNNIFLKDHKVNGFNEYYNLFFQYAERLGYNYPMTFSGFQRSKHSNIFTSGLAIAIADLDIGDDSLKEKYFIDSPGFSFFKRVCLNNGMVLVENSPWIMTADILSPALSVYTKNYNLSSNKSIFLKYFNYCINKDIDLLFNIILIYYTKYYNRNKYYNNITLCKENNIKIEKVFLETININTIKNTYTDSYIYEMYINLKNIEEYGYFGKGKLKQIIKKARFLNKTVDNSEAISYIRLEFREIHKFREGSLNQLNNKAIKRRNNDISDT
jgi:hypothetical protein